MRERADPSDALVRGGRVGLEGDGGDETDALGQGVSHSPVGGVEAGVGVEERDAGPDEAVDGAALGVGGRDVVGTAQVEGVVGDNHVDTGVDSLLDDGCHRVDGQQDAVHRLGGGAADEPVGVPGGGQAGGGGGLHEGDDVTDGQVAFRRAACRPVSGLRGCGGRSVTHATRLAVGREFLRCQGTTKRGACVWAYDGTQWGKRPTRPPSGVTYFRAVGPSGAGSVGLLDAVDAVAAPP